ncbi:hypothetical protein MnTg04_01642 [bacterium MnTg04]|nr:hypothetical protein MnTg04_01642 [bacterium MnTg04]
MRKKGWLFICGALASAHFLFAPPLAAQDENAGPPAEREGQEEPAPAGPAGDSSAAEDSPQTIDDLDSFVPSVEISSDLSVSYPVDI